MNLHRGCVHAPLGDMIPCQECLRVVISRLRREVERLDVENARLREERDEYHALLERAVKQADSILDRWDASLGGRSPRTT